MRRFLLVLLLVVVAVPAALLLFADAILNTEAVRGRAEAAATRAAGHAVRIEGPLGFSLSPEPRLSAERVRVLNPPGFSRAELLTLGAAEVSAELPALLSGRLAVRQVTLREPDLLLERDAAGRGNWERDPPGEAAAAAVVPAEPSAPRRAVPVAAMEVVNGRVALRGGAPALAVPYLRASPSGGPVSGELRVGGTVLALGGTAGAELAVSATAPGVSLLLSGRAEAPALEARVADLSALSPLAGRSLPPLRDVVLSAAASGPLRLRAGASPLDGVLPGLVLEELRAEADGLAAPLRVSGAARWRDLKLALTAEGPPVGASSRGGGLPLSVRLEGDGARLVARGTVDLRGGSAEGTVSAAVPDLARTGALAGQRWPALRDATLDARVLPRPGGGGGGGGGVLVRGLRLASSAGDLAGDLALGTEPRLFLRGSLVSGRLDGNALRGTVAAAVPEGVPEGTPGPAPVASPAPAAPAGPVAAPAPFAWLRTADADLQVEVGELALGDGPPFRAGRARLLLADGRLRLDPVQVLAPGGAPISAQLAIDAAASPPALSLNLRAPAVDAAPLAAAFGRPGALGGGAFLDLALTGAGNDARALAATVSGRAAVALVDGEVDNGALLALLGPLLRAAGPLAAAAPDAAGRSHLRCFALRAEARNGAVTLRTLALDAGRLRLEGDGSVDLAGETLDLHLRPTLRVGGTTVVAPLLLNGPLRAPRAAAERGVLAPGRFGFSLGGPAAPDPCPGALDAVRGR